MAMYAGMYYEGAFQGPFRGPSARMALARDRSGSTALVAAGAAELPAELEGFDAHGNGTTAQVLRGDEQVVRARREACRAARCL